MKLSRFRLSQLLPKFTAGLLPLPAAAQDTAGPQQRMLSAAGGGPDINDIYGPLQLPDPVNWPLWLAAAAAAVLLIAGVSLFLKRRGKKETPAATIAPHQTALAELALARKFLEEGRAILYAERISEILRLYIEQRFALRPTRQTTAEFLASLKDQQSGQALPLTDHKDVLEHCLSLCDMSKYAHMQAGREQLEELEGKVRRFIEETMAEEM